MKFVPIIPLRPVAARISASLNSYSFVNVLPIAGGGNTG